MIFGLSGICDITIVKNDLFVVVLCFWHFWSWFHSHKCRKVTNFLLFFPRQYLDSASLLHFGECDHHFIFAFKTNSIPWDAPSQQSCFPLSLPVVFITGQWWQHLYPAKGFQNLSDLYKLLSQWSCMPYLFIPFDLHRLSWVIHC